MWLGTAVWPSHGDCSEDGGGCSPGGHREYGLKEKGATNGKNWGTHHGGMPPAGGGKKNREVNVGETGRYKKKRAVVGEHNCWGQETVGALDVRSVGSTEVSDNNLHSCGKGG